MSTLTRTPVILLALLVLSSALGGCTFHRVKSNPSFANIDPTAVQVGKSTWRDVLNTFGPPSSGTTAQFSLAMPNMVTFHYAQADEKNFNLLLAYILFLPFRWGDQQTGRELVVEFDEEGVVSDLYLVQQQSVWRPFQSPREHEVVFYGPTAEVPPGSEEAQP